MTVRLVTGPPGAGKNHYVSEHAAEDDYVLDFDEIREMFPTIESAKAVRDSIEESLKGHKGDAWVIRCAADPTHRANVAERCGADEVIVIETPADVAKARLAERGESPERMQELSDAVDKWWSQYSMVESNLIVKPDTGNLSDREKNKMGDTDHNNNDDSKDKGFPADTPVAEMTPEQQAAYWKFHSRKHENTVKSQSDYDELKALAEKYKAEHPEPKPEGTVDADKIREEAEKAAAQKFATKLVVAEFKTQMAGRMSNDDFKELIEDLNLTNYLDKDGEVDTDRVAKKAAILAPESRGGGTRRTHQTRRQNDKAATVSSGKDLYEEMHGKK